MRRSCKSLLALAAVAALVGCSKSKPAPEKEEGEGKTETAETAVKEEKPGEAGPVAIVNGKPIPAAEFNEMYEKMTRVYTKRNQPVPENVARRHKRNILKRLIEKALLRQQIEKGGVVVTDEELNAGLSKYKEMFRTEANFQRYLKNSNTSLDKIKGNIRYNKSLDKLLEKGGPIEVTEAQAKEYYEQNKRRYQEREQVKASHILFKVAKEAKPGEDAAGKKKAGDVAVEAKKKGADFAALARKHSQGPTAPKGGDLGYFARGRMDKAFEEVAFKLKPGEVSAPVRSKFGWHVIKVFDHRPPGEKPYEEVKDSIVKLLESRERRLRKSRLLREVRGSAKIEKLLAIPEPQRTKSAGSPKIKLDKLKGAAGSVKLTPTLPPGATSSPGAPPPARVVPKPAPTVPPTAPAPAAPPAR